MKMSPKNQLVFVPFPIIGHLVSAVETAKLLVERDQLLSITVLVMKQPNDTKIDDFIKNTPNSRINFIDISESPDLIAQLKKSPDFVFRLIESQKERVRAQVVQLMKKNQEGVRVLGLVIDMMCTAMIDVANELRIPSFIFSPSGASVHGLLFHLQSLADQDLKTIIAGDGNAEMSISAYVHPVPVRVLPSIVLAGDNDFMNLPKRFRETNGMLINTFLELEPHAISALMGDEKIPPVYPIGPILQPLQGEETGKNRGKKDEIIKWLNSQPDSSVVFICFGSMGFFEKDQVMEIAMGLEQSGQRFLWSLRKPPPKGTMDFPEEYENPEEVLPEGFLKRVDGKGKVIGWAPQLTILSHPATGGFVSHCGWNSTLESVSCGVPMAVWPLASEQQMNAFLLVKELGVANEIQMDYRVGSDVIVGAEKIEDAIRELMEPENEIRAKVKVIQNKSKVAMVEGESSYDGLGRFLDDIKQSYVP